MPRPTTRCFRYRRSKVTRLTPALAAHTILVLQVCYTLVFALVPLLYNCPSPITVAKSLLEEPQWTHSTSSCFPLLAPLLSAPPTHVSLPPPFPLSRDSTIRKRGRHRIRDAVRLVRENAGRQVSARGELRVPQARLALVRSLALGHAGPVRLLAPHCVLASLPAGRGELYGLHGGARHVPAGLCQLFHSF